MKERISSAEAASVFAKASAAKLISKEDTSVVFYDMSFLVDRISEVKNCFPANSLHTAAVKANPVVNVLKLIKKERIGLEAASLPEVYISEKCGYEKDKIIFDSPAKTEDEIKYALNTGIHLNADSLEELEIVNNILSLKGTKSSIGLRVNPQAGTGKIAITSVAGEYSKFGVPVKEFRKEIIDAYLKYEWLNGIHLHVGSQGCPLELLLKGVGTVYELAIEINSLLEEKGRGIKFFDIGGGYPVSYYSNESPLSIKEYAEGIKKNFPLLFTDKFKLITEFGRYYFANTAFAISRIDNIKHQKGISTIVSHLGADFFVRRVYNPEFWHHDISIMNGKGIIKDGERVNKYVIGGPLCFSGDMIEKEITLPDAVKGDYLIFHDVGAYTHSMWSRYNSRQMPKIIGYYNGGEKFTLLKERESLESVYKFWE